MVFFQSTAFGFDPGVAEVLFFAAGVDGSTAAGGAVVGTTADAGFVANVRAEAASGDELVVAATPAAPSPTTSNGAQ